PSCCFRDAFSGKLCCCLCLAGRYLMEDYLPVSLLRQKLLAALRAFDYQLCCILSAVPGKSHRSLYKFPFFVIFCFAVVFIEYKTSVCAGINMKTHFFRIFLDT